MIGPAAIEVKRGPAAPGAVAVALIAPAAVEDQRGPVAPSVLSFGLNDGVTKADFPLPSVIPP